MMNNLSLLALKDLLNADDAACLAELDIELFHNWTTAQMFRTRTEMIVSVLNDIKHPTPDSKYWQAVREQDVMFGELMALSFDYRKNAIELRKLDRQISLSDDDLEREMAQIEKERLIWVAGQMRRVAAHRMREIAEWSHIKAELKSQLQYGTDDVDVHQLNAMRERFRIEASLVTEHTPLPDARNVLGLVVTAQRQKDRLEISQ